MHLALGGCLRAPPIRYGITADTGGHIAYVVEAALAQAATADRVTIVTRAFDDDRLGAVHSCPHEELAANVAIVRIATSDRRYLQKEDLAADLPAFADALLATLAQGDRPDVIHAHFADAAAVAIKVRERFGIPFFYTPHALGIDKRVRGVADAILDHRIEMERAAIARADGVIVSTDDERSRQVAAYEAGLAHVHCLVPGVPRHPAVDAGLGEAVLRDHLDDSSKPIVFAVARGVGKKNLMGLMTAFAETQALNEVANLVILAGQHGLGMGSAEEAGVVAELKAAADRPAMRGRVALPGTHTQDDVAALYAKAAQGGVFVNAAFHEPFGLTLIEAAAAGVPVVATRNGGPRDILAAIGHGILVDPEDTKAIGAAALRIVTNRDLHARYAAAGLAGCGAFSWSAYARASIDLYAAACARRRDRIVACDIDHTLTGCADGARRFADWSATRGAGFVVATGRSFDAARAILGDWGLPCPDAFITDVGTRLMRRDDEGGWDECPAYAAALDEDWDRDGVADRLAQLPIAPQPAHTATRHKLSFYGSAGEAAQIRSALTDAGFAARTVFSHERLIDVLAPRAGKAAAIAHYAGGKGLTLADCVACGDSGNDRDMLEACGQAILVGNADEDLADLPDRPGLIRAKARHASGVMEGLAAIGLVDERIA